MEEFESTEKSEGVPSLASNPAQQMDRILSERLDTENWTDGNVLLTARDEAPPAIISDVYAPRRYNPLPNFRPVKAREQIGDTPLSRLSNFFTVQNHSNRAFESEANL